MNNSTEIVFVDPPLIGDSGNILEVKGHLPQSGIKSFDGLVNNLNSFQEASKDPIRQFQEAVGYPVR